MQILALYVRESTSKEGALRPLNVNVLLLRFLTSAKRFFFFFFFFSESQTQQEVVTYTSGSPHPPALSHPQSTCTCRHFLNRCPHLPGTTAKPAVITCVKTRVQGITEGNRAIYKLLADCFKGCGSCTMYISPQQIPLTCASCMCESNWDKHVL